MRNLPLGSRPDADLSLHLDPCGGPVRLFSCSLPSKDSNQQLKVTHRTQAQNYPRAIFYRPHGVVPFFFLSFFTYLYFSSWTPMQQQHCPITLKLPLIHKTVYLALCLQPTAENATSVSASMCEPVAYLAASSSCWCLKEGKLTFSLLTI